MPAFLFAFLAAALATLAGRDAVRVARLSAAHGSRGGSTGVLLAALALAAIAQAALAAGLAYAIIPMLPAKAAGLLAALALGLAGAEVLLLRAGPPPREPTRSFAATAIVLFAALLTGATGFLIAALAVLSGMPVMAGAGGAFGTLAALGVAMAAGGEWDGLPHWLMRLGGGAILLLAALVIGLGAL